MTCRGEPLLHADAKTDDPCDVMLQNHSSTLTTEAMADALNWVVDPLAHCGGYYLEPPFEDLKHPLQRDYIEINFNQAIFTRQGTSTSEGKVTITRNGQQINANKVYLYRDPVTEKFNAIDLLHDVTLREPDHLIRAECGHIDLKSKKQFLHHILYRTTLYNSINMLSFPNQNQDRATMFTQDTLMGPLQQQQLAKPHRIDTLSAWGRADQFSQTDPKIYVFKNATYSTCPITSPMWTVKTSQLILNKNTGRGVARDARVLVKGIPIFYTPYFNFPIDARRKSGFLFPTMGTSSQSGAYFRAPFYWNMAPNYDSTITPNFLAKRGVQVSDTFRYLTPTSHGKVIASILPNDKAFSTFQTDQLAQNPVITDPVLQAEMNRLQNAKTTRTGLSWQDDSIFNANLSSNIDYNYVSDDYYLRNLGGSFDEITQNQLLQKAELTYKQPYWKVLGRVQAYQTLHPFNEPTVENQYKRLPQIIAEGHYPTSNGFDYFIANDVTHFDIQDNPGSNTKMPIGNRFHTQPGIQYSYQTPAFYMHPRLQAALTQYSLGDVPTSNLKAPGRALPIVDVDSGVYLDRHVRLFHHNLRQTLEPEVYYTYVPYRDQSEIPVFDTTLNTLTYDQLFTYNRFSGIDRIGDANQISVGVTTRFISEETGYEKIRAGIGQIFYFVHRRVTLCNDPSICSDNPTNPDNRLPRSPLSGILQYYLNPSWNVEADTIWDPKSAQLNNQTVTLHYQPEPNQLFNIGYSFVRNGNQLPGEGSGGENNLSQTDISFAVPISQNWSTVARWTKNWNDHHFQNLLYGLQYDSCCWAVRFVTGRTFTNLNANQTPQYDTQFFIQFALKGLGNIGNADPSQLLSNSIAGYQTQFG